MKQYPCQYVKIRASFCCASMKAMAILQNNIHNWLWIQEIVKMAIFDTVAVDRSCALTRLSHHYENISHLAPWSKSSQQVTILLWIFISLVEHNVMVKCISFYEFFNYIYVHIYAHKLQKLQIRYQYARTRENCLQHSTKRILFFEFTNCHFLAV